MSKEKSTEELEALLTLVKGIEDRYTLLVGEDAMYFGPGHLVWSDENYDSAEWCINHFEKFTEDSPFSKEKLKLLLESLHELIKIPLDDREQLEFYLHNPQ